MHAARLSCQGLTARELVVQLSQHRGAPDHGRALWQTTLTTQSQTLSRSHKQPCSRLCRCHVLSLLCSCHPSATLHSIVLHCCICNLVHADVSPLDRSVLPHLHPVQCRCVTTLHLTTRLRCSHILAGADAAEVQARSRRSSGKQPNYAEEELQSKDSGSSQEEAAQSPEAAAKRRQYATAAPAPK